ncbi:cytochrome P450 78A5-like [Salvia hispanica]|uniref:cytochrome P450 78A5-like n=1 Tax=Salvia hispanica TaxID=49212 RepID=UPI0020090290|nr:cytochrome P450 78A5-like [Salvia hispanica]
MWLDYTFLFTPSTTLSLFFLLFAAVFGLWLTPGGLAWALYRAQSRPTSSIPGPSGLPLLGLALSFTHPLTHRALARLSNTFKSKPLMAFSVGLTRFVISSDRDTAKQILCSSAFADRPVKESARLLMFDRAMGFAPYGDYWRSLRRISAAHLFGPRRVARLGRVRGELAGWVAAEAAAEMEREGEVRVRRVLHLASLNNVMMSVFGKRYDFGENGEGLELEGLVREGYELLSVFNWSDHFAYVGLFDWQRIRKRSFRLVEKVNVFVGKIVEKHRVKRANQVGFGGDDDDDDFVDVLLDLEKETKLSDSDMIAVLWEMIFRGTDTVAILLEWILARMILHPEIQAKAQNEIDNAIGLNTTVADSDLPNLPYIQAIVKETLRLHPPGPLLSWARLAIHDTQVGPHFVPAGTTAMVNMWAITHDEGVWPEPERFRPERFLEDDVAIMGSDLRLAPFGSGRRVCPGKSMGLATVQLWLAHLLHKFKWTACPSGGVDLSECLKLSMEMKQPLVCKAIPRIS